MYRRITKRTGSLLSNLTGISSSSDQNPKSLFEHIIFDDDTVEERHFLNGDESIQNFYLFSYKNGIRAMITTEKNGIP